MPTHAISVDNNPANPDTGDAPSRPYKSYIALISQTGTDAPTAIVLENTLGEVPVLSRVDAGISNITATIFEEDKTYYYISQNSLETTFKTFFNGLHSVQILDDNYVDDVLLNTVIEIRVYQ